MIIFSSSAKSQLELNQKAISRGMRIRVIPAEITFRRGNVFERVVCVSIMELSAHIIINKVLRVVLR